MLESLREEVLEANLEVVRRGLVLYTFGNASGIDRARGLVVIKPSGVDYSTLKASDLVIFHLDGKPVEGTPYVACPAHHPDHEGNKRSVSEEVIKLAHKAHLEREASA